MLSLAQSEMNDRLAGGLIASRSPNLVYLFTARGLDRNSRTHGSLNSEEPAAVGTPVFEKMWSAIQIHHQNIEVAILVEVPRSGAAVGPRFTHSTAGRPSEVRELSITQVPEQLTSLEVTSSNVHGLDLRINMAVGNKQILPAIVVKVSKKSAPPQTRDGGPGDACGDGLI